MKKREGKRFKKKIKKWRKRAKGRDEEYVREERGEMGKREKMCERGWRKLGRTRRWERKLGRR